MIRLSANLGMLWPDRPLEARIDAAASAGFRAIELHWPYDVPAERVKALCQQHDLRLLGLNTWPGDLDKGERGFGAVAGREDDFRRTFDQALAYAAAAGGTAIHVMAGIAPPSLEAQDVLVDNLRSVAARAGEAGVTLLCEGISQASMPGYFYSRTDDVADIVRRCDHPAIRMMFDVFHVAMEEGDPLPPLRRHLPLIGHIQVAGVPERHEPGGGAFDYGRVFREIEASGYGGYVGAEYNPAGDTDTGLGWISEFGLNPRAR